MSFEIALDVGLPPHYAEERGGGRCSNCAPKPLKPVPHLGGATDPQAWCSNRPIWKYRLHMIPHLRPVAFACLAQLLVLFALQPARAQAGFEDDRVMLQGFYWESYRHGHPEK